MDGYINITLDLSNYGYRAIDIAINEEMTSQTLIFETFKLFNLDFEKINNIIIINNRNGHIITGSETLIQSAVRNGDVLVLR